MTPLDNPETIARKYADYWDGEPVVPPQGGNVREALAALPELAAWLALAFILGMIMIGVAG
jgi:hypothetical protein